MASAARVNQQLTEWLGGADVPIWDLFIKLPDGLDETLLTRVFAKFLKDPHRIGVVGRALNPTYVELFLKSVEKLPSSPQRSAALSVPQRPAKERSKILGSVLKKTRQLNVFSMSRSQASSRAREFAKDEHFVAAAQQIVLAAKFSDDRAYWRYSMIEVLLNDASAESLDALLPVVHAAVKERADDFDALRALLQRLKNPKPTLAPLRELLEGAAGSQPGRQEFERLRGAFGLTSATLKTLRFTWQTSARVGTQHVAHASFNVNLESSDWFSMRVSVHQKHSRLSATEALVDSLRLGKATDVTDFPRWLAAAAKKVERAEWTSPWFYGNVRGKDRVRITQWARSLLR
ncbi:MAG: hypothetical protein QM817_41290 [Archangium sp.]